MRSSPIRILVADDHPVVREGLRRLLGTEPGMAIVGETADGESAVEAARRLRPDVILMDLVMPGGVDGVEATRRILAENEAARILVLTSYGTDDKLFHALRAGALGALLKDASGKDLAGTIRRVAEGESSLHPEVARHLLGALVHGRHEVPLEDPLTAREVEVLREIAHGLGNDEIGEKLFISPKTVRTHISHILAKLHVSRRTQAALFALRHGIAELNDSPEAETKPAR